MKKRSWTAVLAVSLFALSITQLAHGDSGSEADVSWFITSEVFRGFLSLFFGILVVWVGLLWERRRRRRALRNVLLSLGRDETGDCPPSLAAQIPKIDEHLDTGRTLSIRLDLMNKELWLDMIKTTASQDPVNAPTYFRLIDAVDNFNRCATLINSEHERLRFRKTTEDEVRYLTKLLRFTARESAACNQAVIEALRALKARKSDVAERENEAKLSQSDCARLKEVS